MGNLNDKAITSWINSGKRFEKSDGDGLTLVYREGYLTPVWRLRYRFANKARVMVLGSFGDVSLADARKAAKGLRARITLGHDVAGEKQERKQEAVAKIEAAKNALTVAKLADEFFERNILGRWKHPNIVRSRIEKDIKPNIGKYAVEDVKPRHIDAMLQTIVKRGAKTVANDVLRWTRRLFDYAVKRHMVEYNPASAFDLSDAGGQEEARTRALSRDELVAMFEAMRKTPGFSVENALTFKLLLLLAVRKSELTNARVDEFDLSKAVWKLPAERTKTEAALNIPLPTAAVDALRELVRLGNGADYLLPARKAQERMLPHIHENTLNVALSKVRKQMPGVENFTIHDFRRTARTHLAALGVDAHVAERCLNHKIKGVEGIYNIHDYFDERRAALAKWAVFVQECETEKPAVTAPTKRKVKS